MKKQLNKSLTRSDGVVCIRAVAGIHQRTENRYFSSQKLKFWDFLPKTRGNTLKNRNSSGNSHNPKGRWLPAWRLRFCASCASRCCNGHLIFEFKTDFFEKPKLKMGKLNHNIITNSAIAAQSLCCLAASSEWDFLSRRKEFTRWLVPIFSKIQIINSRWSLLNCSYASSEHSLSYMRAFTGIISLSRSQRTVSSVSLTHTAIPFCATCVDNWNVKSHPFLHRYPHHWRGFRHFWNENAAEENFG